MARRVFLGFWLVAALSLAGEVVAGEALLYLAEVRGAVTLWSWADVGEATVTTSRGVPCPGGGQCDETRLWITSEGAPSLEKIYPLRYLYRTAYRPEERATQAVETLSRRKSVDDPQDYRWRHRVVWLAGMTDKLVRYDLATSGKEMPADVAAWITPDKAEGKSLKVKNVRKASVKPPVLDRWGVLQLVRTLDLKDGKEWRLAGVHSKGNLEFLISVQGREQIQAGGRIWTTKKLSVVEREPGAGEDTLFVWIAEDNERTPVRFDMEHEIGRMRLTLK